MATEKNLVHRTAQADAPVIIQPGVVQTATCHDCGIREACDETCPNAGVTDDRRAMHSGAVNQSISPREGT